MYHKAKQRKKECSLLIEAAHNVAILKSYMYLFSCDMYEITRITHTDTCWEGYTHIETCVHVCAYLYMNILTVSQIHNTYSKGMHPIRYLWPY